MRLDCRTMKTLVSSRVLALACCLVAAIPLAPVVHAAPDLGFLERYALTRGFRSGQPASVRIPREGNEVLFLRSGARDRTQSLWSFDPRTGEEREVLTGARLLGGGQESLSAEERARRERLRMTARGLSSFELSQDGRRLLLPYSGRLFVVDRPGYAVHEVPAPLGAAPADAAHLSPDGTRIALVRAGTMCVVDVASGLERVIAAPESSEVSYGLAEFVAQEEMDRFDGHWWSPDGQWLAVQRTDHTGVERLRIMDPSNPTQAPEANPYPRPGMRNDDVRLGLFPVAGGAPLWVQWDREAWPYLCSVVWPKSGPLTLYVMDRRQQRASLLRVDVATGLTAPLLGERDAAWINLPKGAPAWLADEPAARQTLADGAALVTFSGDKLFGGPQSGVIAGRADLVAACAAHPLARALRPGAHVLLAMQQVALRYLDRSAAQLPFWAMVATPPHQLRERAEHIVAAAGFGRVVDSEAVPGAGSAPGVTLPSVAVSLDGDLMQRLRHHTPPIVARRRDATTLLDLRSVHPSDDVHLIAALRACVS